MYINWVQLERMLVDGCKLELGHLIVDGEPLVSAMMSKELSLKNLIVKTPVYVKDPMESHGDASATELLIHNCMVDLARELDRV
jgi:hypothetical protein